MDVDTALQSQIRNIETTYGKPLSHWLAVIDASGQAAVDPTRCSGVTDAGSPDGRGLTRNAK